MPKNRISEWMIHLSCAIPASLLVKYLSSNNGCWGVRWVVNISIGNSSRCLLCYMKIFSGYLVDTVSNASVSIEIEYIYCIGSQCSGKNNHVSECSNHTFNQIHLLYFQNTYHRVLNSTETITKSNASTNASNFPNRQKSTLYHNHHYFNLSGHIVTLQLALCRAKPNQAFVWQPELRTCNH